MSPNYNESEDRKTILTRFIIFYCICVLCITVPLYYLFNIPDKVLGQLNASRFSEKSELKKLDRIQAIVDELDTYVKENNYEKEYEYGFKKLFIYAKDSVDQSGQDKIFLLKISDLYEQIAKIYELGGKAEIERLTKEMESKDMEIEKLKDDLNECTIDLKVLQRNSNMPL